MERRIKRKEDKMNNLSTRIRISLSLEAVVPTSQYQSAEKAMINRLRTALKHCETLAELDHYFEGGINIFDYSAQNEAVDVTP